MPQQAAGAHRKRCPSSVLPFSEICLGSPSPGPAHFPPPWPALPTLTSGWFLNFPGQRSPSCLNHRSVIYQNRKDGTRDMSSPPASGAWPAPTTALWLPTSQGGAWAARAGRPREAAGQGAWWTGRSAPARACPRLAQALDVSREQQDWVAGQKRAAGHLLSLTYCQLPVP